MNRKGVIDDIFVWTGLLFVVGIGIILVYILFDGINSGIQDNSQFTTHGKQVSQDFFNRFPVIFDYTFLTVFISAYIGLLIISWFLDSNPALFFAIVFVVLLMGLLGGVLSNAYIETTSSGVLATASSNFPITNHIMSNLVPYVIVSAFSMVILFFSKPGGDGI